MPIPKLRLDRVQLVLRLAEPAVELGQLVQPLLHLEQPVLDPLVPAGLLQLLLERLHLGAVHHRLGATDAARLQRGQLVRLQDEEAEVVVGRGQAALDAQEGLDLQVVLGQRGELLARGVEALQLPRAAQLAQQPVRSAVSGDEPQPHPRGALAVDQTAHVVGAGEQGRQERAAQRDGPGDHGHVSGPQGDLPLRAEILHPLVEQLGELHVAFAPRVTARRFPRRSSAAPPCPAAGAGRTGARASPVRSPPLRSSRSAESRRGRCAPLPPRTRPSAR